MRHPYWRNGRPIQRAKFYGATARFTIRDCDHGGTDDSLPQGVRAKSTQISATSRDGVKTREMPIALVIYGEIVFNRPRYARRANSRVG